ncbi:putative glycoside hydrolase subgroup catalytic core [Phaeomoniella chlamydospora]|uniref:Putative glycoside hydrolase subgroup catalytic core n=1 Tax=Phaeomoniella chlamydospora TaxID=158046 RepID=A0A0G2EDE8_PHACM|nr:putative glycoside hydrolase subgroup catalytic core [Phaeomoniella chlamydospora]
MEILGVESHMNHMNVPLSHYYGVTYSESDNATTGLEVTISLSGNKSTTLATSRVRLNTTGNEIPFSLTDIKPRMSPYSITLTVSSPGDKQVYTSTTQLSYLPNPVSGSVTKIDNLYQGLSVAKASDLTQWIQLFPYGWYADSSLVNDTTNADTFLAAGYNFIHFVPDDSKPLEPFTKPDFNLFLDRMDEIGLYLIYDMRGTYQNSTLLNSQVSQYKNRTCLLMWYTADEPDGWSYPLNSTQLAYSQIKTLDPYHPVSLVLNCIDFYYESYSLGADILLEDAYPISINATWSTQFNTPCTWDYGDCGCDGCIGSITDVSTRIDILRSYQAYYNQRKPIYAVPQGFGNETYWTRYPSSAEEIAMQQLALNHHAMGISTWIYPSDTELNEVTSSYAKSITHGTAPTFLLNTLPIPLTAQISNHTTGTNRKSLLSFPNTTNTTTNALDISIWLLPPPPSQNTTTIPPSKIMLSLINLSYNTITEPITINLPTHVETIKETIWGNETGWELRYRHHGNEVGDVFVFLWKGDGLKGLEVGVFVLE